MTRAALALGLLLGAGSCGGGKAKPTSAPAEGELDFTTECDRYQATMTKWRSCPQLSADASSTVEAKQFLMQQAIDAAPERRDRDADQTDDEVGEGENPVRPATAQDCHDGAEEAVQAIAALGCE